MAAGSNFVFGHEATKTPLESRYVTYFHTPIYAPQQCLSHSSTALRLRDIIESR